MSKNHPSTICLAGKHPSTICLAAKHPSTFCLAAKHPKHSELSIDNMWENPVTLLDGTCKIFAYLDSFGST